MEPEQPSGWPLDSVATELAKADPSSPCAVVVSTGALNPPHRGHAAVLCAARDVLTAAGYAVLGGFLSASHDLYVRPKAARAGVLAIPAAERSRLASLVLEGAGLAWAHAAQWEHSQHGHWPDFPEVVDALGAALAADPRTAAAAAAGRLTVFYACGEDHWRHVTGGRRGGGDFYDRAPRAGVVVVPREGRVPDADALNAARLVLAAGPTAPEVSALSSTALRAAAAAGGCLDSFLPAAAAAAYAELMERGR